MIIIVLYVNMKISYIKHNAIMSVLSVPLTPELAMKIDQLIEAGIAPNKAEAARMAIDHFIEEKAVEAVLKAEQEVKDGKILRGDLDDLAKKL